MAGYRSLSHGWSLAPSRDAEVPARVAAGPVPAAVPGCVHTDLLAAGLIPDPYRDDNEAELAWIGEAGWTYRTTFTWTSDNADRVDLVCQGLDTVATLTLNGVELGRTANMHRSYRLALSGALRQGENRLAVEFESPLKYARKIQGLLPGRPHAYIHPYNYIRKMACNFGWDWGPALVTSGIWRPIGLQSWSRGRFETVRPQVTLDGRVDVHADIARDGDEPLVLAAAVGGIEAQVTVMAGQSSADVSLKVPDPAIWWPRGYGEQPRYELTVTLSTPDGVTLDRWQRRIGFRSVHLDTASDEYGSAYTLVVNDMPLFVRGVNWIPDDCFPSRLTRHRYAQRLRQAAEAGVNYLRIWGGGIYESDDFYDVADELGLLVGQDFLFACAAYPEEPSMAEEVAAEAREQVARLASHPSLVTWTGNNECLWGFHDWGWKEQLGERTWGGGYYLKLLPQIVSDVDPTRPYWPGSPYSGDLDRHPNDPGHGTTHQWDVWWKSPDYTRYRDSAPRFVAEFGFQGPPSWPAMRHGYHQKADGGDDKIAKALAAHLPPPRDDDDWHYLAQLNQARAISLGVEHFRSHHGRCMGTVVWQLNDCWPVVSWSAVDGDGRRKLLWHALRHSYAPRLVTIQPRDGALALVAVNDAGSPWRETVVVRRVAIDGRELAVACFDIDVPASTASSQTLPAALSTPDDERAELLVAEDSTRRAWWFFAEDRDMAYPPADYEAAAETTPAGIRVTVTARTILRDIAMFPDRLDPSATVDSAVVTLLPGESASFTIQSDHDLDTSQLITAPVLRCVNDHIQYQRTLTA